MDVYHLSLSSVSGEKSNPQQLLLFTPSQLKKNQKNKVERESGCWTKQQSLLEGVNSKQQGQWCQKKTRSTSPCVNLRWCCKFGGMCNADDLPFSVTGPNCHLLNQQRTLFAASLAWPLITTNLLRQWLEFSLSAARYLKHNQNSSL